MKNSKFKASDVGVGAAIVAAAAGTVAGYMYVTSNDTSGIFGKQGSAEVGAVIGTSIAGALGLTAAALNKHRNVGLGTAAVAVVGLVAAKLLIASKRPPTSLPPATV